MDKKELIYGKTPLDAMSREQLLEVSKTMYAALVSAHSSLHVLRHGALYHDPNNGYWTRQGRGNAAFQQSEQAIEKARDGYSDEDIHRSYFRYATSLLFKPWEGNDEDQWIYCDGCDMLMGAHGNHVNGYIGIPHAKAPMPETKPDCPGTLKALTLEVIENFKQVK